jgi:hypothetical protein
LTNNSKTIIVTAITIIEVTIIKFYNRDQEKKQLNDITSQTNQYGRMTVITGRRIGKTAKAQRCSWGCRNRAFLVSEIPGTPYLLIYFKLKLI